MSTNGETADMVVRESIQITESAVKLAGLGAKNLAALLVAVAKDNPKLSGKTGLKRLIQDGEELAIFSVKQEDLRGFQMMRCCSFAAKSRCGIKSTTSKSTPMCAAQRMVGRSLTSTTLLCRTTRCPTCLTNFAHWTTIHFWRTNMKLKKPNTIARAVCAGVGLTLCCLVPVYATGGDPLTIVNNLSDFIFSVIKAIGIIILGWGIVQVGMSIQSHDASQRTQGLLCLFGGLLIAFAKEILTLIGAV